MCWWRLVRVCTVRRFPPAPPDGPSACHNDGSCTRHPRRLFLANPAGRTVLRLVCVVHKNLKARKCREKCDPVFTVLRAPNRHRSAGPLQAACGSAIAPICCPRRAARQASAAAAGHDSATALAQEALLRGVEPAVLRLLPATTTQRRECACHAVSAVRARTGRRPIPVSARSSRGC